MKDSQLVPLGLSSGPARPVVGAARRRRRPRQDRNRLGADAPRGTVTRTASRRKAVAEPNGPPIRAGPLVTDRFAGETITSQVRAASELEGPAIFRFLHTGDLHLDSPFVGLTTVAPPAVSRILREATLQTWSNIVRLALEEHVDFLLVAGDAFENANHTLRGQTLRGQLRFRDGLGDLARAGIPSFVVTGNHDPESGWGPSVTWPDLCHRFPASHVEGRPVLRDDEEIARVYGIGYGVRDVRANLAATFHRDAGVPFAVGLLHTNVGCDPSAGNYAPCTIGDLRAADMDYWALGHIHRHRVLSDARPTAVYCGNPQGRDPGEADPRGCYLVTVDDAGAVRPEFRAMDVVRWQLLDVAIDELATDEAVVDQVVATVDDARSDAARSIVARIRLTGRGAVHATLRRTGVLRDILHETRERLGEAVPFAWVESVRDETRSEIDLAERRQADDFLGDVLRRFNAAEQAVAAGGGTEATGIRADLQGVVDGLYANERARRYLRDRQPTAADLARMLRTAETTVADRLGEG
jgi:DNA repair protein SbcD/Mre11